MSGKKHASISVCTSIFVILVSTAAYSFSAAVKSSKDYGFTLNALRRIKIMVDNFGDEQMKKNYSDSEALFLDAAEDYYSQKFFGSASKFDKLKRDLISMLVAMGDLYLKRTKEILDSIAKQSIQIIIEYSKDSGLALYLRQPFDPLRDIKLIDPDKYHLFFDRDKIAGNMQEGYKRYEKAKSIFNDPEIVLLKQKEKLPMDSINMIITSYIAVVNLCRDAKGNGIEIYKILNTNELGKSMVKYHIIHSNIKPVFDDRIPEKYKIDADDNLRLIHTVELKKLNQK
jgi:hypothetical protein